MRQCLSKTDMLVVRYVDRAFAICKTDDDRKDTHYLLKTVRKKKREEREKKESTFFFLLHNFFFQCNTFKIENRGVHSFGEVIFSELGRREASAGDAAAFLPSIL